MTDLIYLAFGLIVLSGVIMVVGFQTFRISPWEHGVLYIDGGFDRLMSPGRHRVWRMGRRLMVNRVWSGPTYFGVGPVDAVTRDGLPVRLSATIIYQIVDVEASLPLNITGAIQLAASQALLALASQEPLETLLTRPEGLGERLKAAMTGIDPALSISQAELGSVILPPELRKMTTEVERARLEGLAQLERARGEQAALRSLANAARMLKDNPELMKLRLLQSVGGAKGATLVLGEAALNPAQADGSTSAGSSS